MSKTNILIKNMLAHRNKSQVAGLMRFFKTGPEQYGEGDKFLGIKVPITRAVVKECWEDMSLEKLEECIVNPYHEIRLAGLLCLVEIFSKAGKKKHEDLQKRCVDFYLAHTDRINNWDLVDLSCYNLLGKWLLDKDRTLLYDLARNGRSIWEKRIGIVSTMAFVRNGQLGDTFSIADIFIENSDKAPLHDLLQKAVGWLLREAGKKDVVLLRKFLNKRALKMPRTMLRYAIEKFPEPERSIYLLKG